MLWQSEYLQHSTMKPYDQLFTWPSLLTLARILLIPMMVLFFYWPAVWGHTVAAIIFIVACLTDWLDGYLARYLEQTTKIGAFLDPVADKLIVSIALVMIVAEPTLNQLHFAHYVIYLPAPILTIPAAIIVARELIVSALRELMAELGRRASVAVSNIGKLKTAIQMVALSILLYYQKGTPAELSILGIIFLYVAAFLTVWSMLCYLKAAWQQLNEC